MPAEVGHQIMDESEKALRSCGALPDTCSEELVSVCLTCGTVAVAPERAADDARCVVCNGEEYGDACNRCHSKVAAGTAGRARPCDAVAVYRKSGRIAFPERIVPAGADSHSRPVGGPEAHPRLRVRESSPWDAAVWACTAVWKQYRGGLGKYAVFNGRSRRSEFWLFVVGQIVVSMAASRFGMGPLILAGTAVPTLAVGARRLHDTGRSGHWLWLLLFWPLGLPVLGLMFMFPGENGPNRFGDKPE